MYARKHIVAWVTLLTVTVGAGVVSATNRNGCFKFADRTINWFNGATGDYYNVFQEEAKTDANAWDPYTNVSLVQVGAAGTTDHINAYSGSYGATGWLALTQITRYSGCTIMAGNIRLNQTYLDTYSRDTRKHQACNGIGRLLGLTTDRTRTGCMNDTVIAPYPSSHDRDVINAIYP